MQARRGSTPSRNRVRKRILFIAEGATMAHFVRPLVLAESLNSSEWDIWFYAPERYAGYLTGKPFVSGVLRTMPGEQFLANLARGAPLFPHDVLRDYVDEDRELMQKVQPDLVVGDLRFSLSVSARVERIPYAALMNAYWSPWAKRISVIPEMPLTRIIPARFLSRFSALAEPFVYSVHVRGFNRIRKYHGLPALPADIHRMYTEADYVLYPDVEEFIPTFGLPATHSYVGTCEWNASVPRPAWWNQVVSKSARRIFVALGSSGPAAAIPAILRAASRLSADVILATSGKQPVPEDTNVWAADLLPYQETASVCDVVVSHGGSSSVYPALTAGTPVLAIPSNADQHLSAAYLVSNGAGLSIRSEEASEGRIRRGLEQVLSDSRYREAARVWQAIFSRYNTAELFRQFVTNFGGSG